MKIRGRTVGTTMPRPDWNQRDPRKADFILNKPEGVICDISGSVVSVCDSSNQVLHNLTLYGKTTQNGTPTPEAPVELVSAGASGAIKTTVAGKNLLPKSAYSNNDVNGIVLRTNSDGGIYCNGTARGQAAPTIQDVTLPAGTYSFWAEVEGTYTALYLQLYYVVDGSLTGNVVPSLGVSQVQTFTLTQTSTIRARFYYPIDAVLNCTIHFQIEAGTAKTAYEPYKPLQTINASTPNGLHGVPVSSGGNYTDENGQAWACDEIDFGRGVYVQRVAKRIRTGESAEYWGFGGISNGHAQFYHGDSNNPKKFGTHNIICSHLPKVNGGSLANISGSNNAVMYYTVPITIASTVNEWKAFVSAQMAAGTPLTILYEVEAPIYRDLSAEELAAYAALHTNKPNTTVYNDAGAGLAVEYIADPKTYIDNKFTALQNAILSAGANI